MTSKKTKKRVISDYRVIVVLVLLMNFLSSCNAVKKSWTINAQIELDGVSKAYLYKINPDRTNNLIDSIAISQKEFSFSGLNTTNELGVYSIKFSTGHGSGITCFVNNGDEINIKILKGFKTIFTGNKIQKDYSKYVLTKQREMDLLKELMTRMNAKTSNEQLKTNRKWYVDETNLINKAKANVISKINNPELNSYLALEEILISSLSDKKNFEMYANSLTKEGNKTVYGKKVLEIIQYYDAYDLLFKSVFTSYESLRKNYNNLDEANKKSKFGKEIYNKLFTLEKLNYGKKAPPIIAKTIEGNEFNLNQIKSKIIMIDFWASWCGSCRLENKNYVKLYNQFKDKGFKIVSYSLDTDLNKWKKAVKKDGLQWINISNLKKQQEDSIVKSYLIDVVPSNVLLKDGKIVGRNLFSNELMDFLNSNL